ncbi:MAG TPA: mobile mystery protein A [Candidatus Nanopelagicaceae bacterium]|nr:mobile mystery protein A [Candidatus Nanopelagicaceae bacterium]
MARTMKASARRQARRALDLKFSKSREALQSLTAVPHAGWVRAIRDALGMSAADLAARMNVVESTVLRLEAAERTGRVQLDSLRRAANALDCDLVYGLVPRRELDTQVTQQARRRAEQALGRVRHTMLLEDQTAPTDLTDELLQEQILFWLDRPGLWHVN